MVEQNAKPPEETKPAQAPATVPPATPRAPVAPNLAMTRRGFDPQTIEEAWRFAKALADSSLVPTTYHGKPGDCIIALDLAARLDAPWLAVMQHIYTVHGRPAMDAALSTALVNRSGIFIDPLEYEVKGEDAFGTDYQVRAYATRKSTSKTLYGPWINWKLVKGEGWLDKDGSKWRTMPEQMFHYRAATWFMRRYCPELTLGMLTAEEAEELPPEAKHVDSQEVTNQLGVNGLLARLKAQQPSTINNRGSGVAPSTIDEKPSGMPQDTMPSPTESMVINVKGGKRGRKSKAELAAIAAQMSETIKTEQIPAAPGTYCPYCKRNVPEEQVELINETRCHLECGYGLVVESKVQPVADAR